MDWEEIKSKYQQAIKLEEDKEFSEAKQILQEMIDNKPDFAPAYNKLGVVFAREGDLDSAEELFNKTVEIWPEFSSPYSNLGNVYLEREDESMAEKYYDKALAINKNNPVPYNNLARIYKKRRQMTKFIQYQKLAHKNRGQNGDNEVFIHYFGEDMQKKESKGGGLGCLTITGALIGVTGAALIINLIGS